MTKYGYSLNHTRYVVCGSYSSIEINQYCIFSSYLHRCPPNLNWPSPRHRRRRKERRNVSRNESTMFLLTSKTVLMEYVVNPCIFLFVTIISYLNYILLSGLLFAGYFWARYSRDCWTCRSPLCSDWANSRTGRSVTLFCLKIMWFCRLSYWHDFFFNFALPDESSVTIELTAPLNTGQSSKSCDTHIVHSENIPLPNTITEKTVRQWDADTAWWQWLGYHLPLMIIMY